MRSDKASGESQPGWSAAGARARTTATAVPVQGWRCSRPRALPAGSSAGLFCLSAASAVSAGGTHLLKMQMISKPRVRFSLAL